MKKVISKATHKDEQKVATIERKEREAFAICQEKIAKHKLDMKLISRVYL